MRNELDSFIRTRGKVMAHKKLTGENSESFYKTEKFTSVTELA